MLPLATLLRNLFGATSAPAARRPCGDSAAARPHLESLESRELLAGDWFSTYIADPGVANLARNDWYGHGAVNRNDMLSIYSKVEADGWVSPSERSSLNFLATYGYLLNTPSSTSYLEGRVVSTDAANQHYQGWSVGAIGDWSPAWKLQDLVNKWFRGLDHPSLTTAGSYSAVSGSLFGAGGPKYTDVYQGALGDCTYLASTAETAARTSAISSMFTYNGDQTWTVRYFRSGSPVYVTVDNMLPNGGNLYDHPYGGVLWVALAEKGLAQLNESGWLGTLSPGINSYAALNNGNQGTMVTALQALSGRSAGGITVGTNGTNIAAAMAAGQLVVLGTGNSTGHPDIEHNHAYAVVAYNPNASLPFTVFNPWGINGGNDGGHVIWGQFSANGAALNAYFVTAARTYAAPGEQTAAQTPVYAGLVADKAEAGGTFQTQVGTDQAEQTVSTAAAFQAPLPGTAERWSDLALSLAAQDDSGDGAAAGVADAVFSAGEQAA